MKLQEKNKKLNQQLLKGEFGIEKESLRVDEKGRLAVTVHPQISSEQISRDFSESQVEFISSVHTSIQKACSEICMLQSIVEEAIEKRETGTEYMWTYSNPPLFEGEGSIRIAEFEGAKENKTTYRDYLAKKYGKAKMLYSGVHLNFSMPKEFFLTLGEENPAWNLTEQKSNWYVNLADTLMSDSWLLVALTAASPVAEEDFLKQLNIPKNEWKDYSSLRNSKYGYWNDFIPELCYTDFSAYLDSMEKYVRAGMISSIQELYYPIRLKPAGENTLENLKKNGVNHVELRMLDLNPMCCAGVAKRDLVFIHLLIAYRIACGGQKFAESCTEQERILLHRRAARLRFWEEEPECREYAWKLLNDMKRFYTDYMKEKDVYIPEDYAVMEVLEFEEKKISDIRAGYASQIREKYEADYIGARMKEIRGTSV